MASGDSAGMSEARKREKLPNHWLTIVPPEGAGGPGADPVISIDSGLLVALPKLSVISTVKSLVSATVGVPVIAPVDASRDRPAGSDPDGTDHVFGV